MSRKSPSTRLAITAALTFQVALADIRCGWGGGIAERPFHTLIRPRWLPQDDEFFMEPGWAVSDPAY